MKEDSAAANSAIQAQARHASVVVQQEHYEGPVPHPRIAQGWEDVVPGSADRLLAMAERQSAHRQWIEKWAVVSRSVSQMLGPVIGGGLGALSVYYGASLLLADKDVSGFLLVLAGIGPLVWAFRRATQGPAKRK